ncbi:uncharacterized protein Dvir_GJ25807 [Drosophila virilis]|uniref:WAP domain-containing protein n=1 Tax=Drosophila virilis TaxID=7244 RepID=A0A0Q9WLN1_DROVI|nr:uncharacterized protein LOC26530577 [Drosophila virilis]KRF81280.1 uncharacterized protein Dvir_GJ25807 [Drosophila virilis]
MQQSSRILCLVLGLWLLLLVKTEKRNFVNKLRTTKAKMPRYKLVELMLVKPSKTMTQAERTQYMDNCKPLGKRCRLAEDCCSLQCIKRRYCVYYDMRQMRLEANAME